MGRRPSLTMQGLKKGGWSEEEDRILFDFVRQNGERDWHLLPQRAGLLRCGKSCRLRWANYLRPGIRRGDFSPHEEETIIRLQASLGNRWATIARHLYRRTDSEVKNYWNTRLKRRVTKGSSGGSSTTVTCMNPRTPDKTPTETTLTEEDNVYQNKFTTTHNNLCETQPVIESRATTTTTGVSELFVDPANSVPSNSSSVRVVLNKMASDKKRLADVHRLLLINDGVGLMANSETSAVSPSAINESELLVLKLF